MVNKEEVKRYKIKQRAIEGFFFMSFRRILLYITAFVSNIILARNLSPYDFGIFGIMSFLVSVISTINDLGLNAAIIQRKKEINEYEKTSIFIFELILTLLYSAIFLIIFPFILKNVYKITIDLTYPMLVMLTGTIFNTIATFQIAFLDKELEFKKVSFIEITSTVIYEFSAIVMSFFHMGFLALVWGFAILNLTQVLFVLRVSTLPQMKKFNFKENNKFLKFGISFQLSNIVNFVKDSLTPLFIGSFAGASAVGFVDWAKNVVTIPTMVTDSFGRIAFPAYAKFQHDKEYLGHLISNSIQIITFATFPITLYIAIFGKDLIRLVYTDKWLPALPALYFFSLGALFTGISVPLYYGILALGESSIIFSLSIILLILEWGFGIPMIFRYGFLGIAIIAGPISWIFACLYYFLLKVRSVHVNMKTTLLKNLPITIVTFTIIFLLKQLFRSSLPQVVLLTIFNVILYFVLSSLFNMETMRIMKNLIIEYIHKKNE